MLDELRVFEKQGKCYTCNLVKDINDHSQCESCFTKYVNFSKYEYKLLQTIKELESRIESKKMIIEDFTKDINEKYAKDSKEDYLHGLNAGYIIAAKDEIDYCKDQIQRIKEVVNDIHGYDYFKKSSWY